jgi:hypothetical protein
VPSRAPTPRRLAVYTYQIIDNVAAKLSICGGARDGRVSLLPGQAIASHNPGQRERSTSRAVVGILISAVYPAAPGL